MTGGQVSGKGGDREGFRGGRSEQGRLQEVTLGGLTWEYLELEKRRQELGLENSVAIVRVEQVSGSGGYRGGFRGGRSVAGAVPGDDLGRQVMARGGYRGRFQGRQVSAGAAPGGDFEGVLLGSTSSSIRGARSWGWRTAWLS